IENIYDLNRGAGSVSEGRFFSDGDSVSYGAVDRSGWQEYTLPGGQQIESSTAISNIRGEQAQEMQELITITPSGRELNRLHGKQFNFPSEDPSDVLDAFETIEDPFAFESYSSFVMLNNGPAWTESYDRGSRTWTRQAPSGRILSVTTLDSKGRPKTIESPGRATATYDYDSFGHIRTITLAGEDG